MRRDIENKVVIYSHNGSSGTKDNIHSKTPDAPSTNDEFDFKIKTLTVKGIEFNYMSKYYSAPSDMDSYMNDSVEAEIEYCEPSKYRTGNERITNLYRANGTFSEDEIGDAYYSAGTDDFKIFKIRVKGKRYETFKGAESYDPPRIDYRKYNAYGAIIANGSIIEYEAFAGRECVPDLDETVYIGLYSSEVSRVDLVVFGLNPQDFKE